MVSVSVTLSLIANHSWQVQKTTQKHVQYVLENSLKDSDDLYDVKIVVQNREGEKQGCWIKEGKRNTVL